MRQWNKVTSFTLAPLTDMISEGWTMKVSRTREMSGTRVKYAKARTRMTRIALCGFLMNEADLLRIFTRSPLSGLYGLDAGAMPPA